MLLAVCAQQQKVKSAGDVELLTVVLQLQRRRHLLQQQQQQRQCLTCVAMMLIGWHVPSSWRATPPFIGPRTLQASMLRLCGAQTASWCVMCGRLLAPGLQHMATPHPMEVLTAQLNNDCFSALVEHTVCFTIRQAGETTT